MCIVVPPLTGGDNVNWAIRSPSTTVTLSTALAAACGGGELTSPIVAAITMKMPTTSAIIVRRSTRLGCSMLGRAVTHRLAMASASTPTMTTSLTISHVPYRLWTSASQEPDWRHALTVPEMARTTTEVKAIGENTVAMRTIR